MAELVYLLCALSSLLCAVALFMKYRSSRIKLLFWSSLGFTGLMLNNVLLFVDLILVPQFDLSVLRTLPAFIGLAAMIWGFVWEIV